MQRIMLAALCAVFSFSASAADLPVLITKGKMRVLSSYLGCGSYYGVHTTGEADRASVAGTPGTVGTPYAVGAAFGLQFGYLCGDGTAWKAIEVDVDYKNIGASSVGTVSGAVDSKWGTSARFKLGGPIASMLNMLPNLSTIFPTFPQPQPGAISNHPYVFGAVHVDDVSGSVGNAQGRATRISGGFGVGIMSELGQAQNLPNGSRVVADTSIEYVAASKSVGVAAVDGTTGAVNPGRGVRVRFGLNY